MDKYMKELVGEDMVIAEADVNAECRAGLAGSEDFAYISRKVPSLMITIGAGEHSKGCVYPQHHPKIVFDEDVLSVGSAAYAYAALRWLEEN